MKTQAFARAKAMMALVAAAMSMASIAARQQALSEIGQYKSRGKGRGTPSRRYGNKAGKYMPHQGRREMERRRVGGYAQERRIELRKAA